MNRLIICSLPIFISLSSCAKVDGNSSKEKNTNSCLVSIKEMTDIVYKVDMLFKCNEKNQAVETIEKNEDKFDLEEKIAIGSILFDNGYYDLSKKYFEYGNDENDAEAQYRLGYLHAYINKNNSLAIIFLKKSIDGGYNESNINLGEIYLFEDDVKDYDQAEKYFKNAINSGLYRGYYGLGEVYLRKKNIKEAKKCFDEAKKHGYYLESPMGLYVTLDFYKSKNIIVARDVEKNQTITIRNVYSGGQIEDSGFISNGTTLPNGKYFLVPDDKHRDWYALFGDDGWVDDFTRDGNRSGFRLHPGRLSLGCVTVKSTSENAEWNKLHKMISATKTTEKVVFKGGNQNSWWRSYGWNPTKVKNWGELNVKD